MKKANEKKTELVVLEAEELPLEQKIDKSLEKQNVTNAVIAKLKEQYGHLKLRSVDDKEQYIEICAARKSVRAVGIIAEKICKHLREDAVKTQKLVLAKEKEILAKIAEVQDPLDAEIKKFEDEQERKEIEDKKRREEQWMTRQSTLLKYGASFQNGHFVLEHIEYEIESLKQADEEMWDAIILPKYRKVFEEKEAGRVAEENRRKEEMERQRLEREKFEKEQAEFRRQQEEFAKQQRELQEQMEKADREERERKEETERKEKERIAKERASIAKLRAEKLSDVEYRYPFVFFKGIKLMDIDLLIDMPNDEFERFTYRHNTSIEQEKVEAERKRQEEEERLAEERRVNVLRQSRKEVLAQFDFTSSEDLGYIADDQWNLIKTTAQEKFNHKKHEEWSEAERIKKQQEDDRKALELAQASDKDKWAAFVSQIQALSHPEMKSPKYKRMQAIAKEKLEEIAGL